MKIIKKILRIIAIILPCFCFTLISFDTHALKYERNSFPYYSLYYYDTNYTGSVERNKVVGLSPALSVDFDVTYKPSSWPTPRFPYGFLSYKNGNNCDYGRGGDSVFSRDFYSWQSDGQSASIGGWPMFVNHSSDYPISECMHLNSQAVFSGFGREDIPNFNVASIPPVGTPLVADFKGYLPYNTNFSNYFINTYNPDTQQGTYLSDDQLFGIPIDKPASIDIPLNFDVSKIGGISAGRSITFKGRFNFLPDSTQTGGTSLISGLNPNVSSFLRINFVRKENGQPHYYSNDSNTAVSCTLNDTGNSAFTFTCDWTAPYDVYENYIGFYLQLSGSTDSSHPGNYIWDYHCDTSPGSTCLDYFKYELVTDHDNTPSSDNIDLTGYGVSLNDAPGGSNFYGDGTNYFNDFLNLFNFSFINPFTPLFGLFTDSSRCVQIPTIAGMLGSESTEYCPWFDSSVRNILTPVLGISANMLLFGFLVKWLGARSGNFVEDTTNKGGK